MSPGAGVGNSGNDNLCWTDTEVYVKLQ